MSRVTSLTSMSDQQLNRWIKRIALLFFVVLIAFVAFYAVDRFRGQPGPDRRPAARHPRGGGPGRSGRHDLPRPTGGPVLRQGPIRGRGRAVHRADRREARRSSWPASDAPGVPEDEPVRPAIPRLREGRRDRHHRRDGRTSTRRWRPLTTASAPSRWRRTDRGSDRAAEEGARDPAHGRATRSCARDRLPGDGPGPSWRSSRSTSRSPWCPSAGRSPTRRSRPPTRRPAIPTARRGRRRWPRSPPATIATAETRLLAIADGEPDPRGQRRPRPGERVEG